MARKRKSNRGGGVLAFVVLGVLGFLGSHPEIIIIGIVLVFLFFMARFNERKKDSAQRCPETESQTIVSSNDPIEKQVEGIIVRNPGIALKENEICVFVAEGFVGKKKTKTVGYNTIGVRTSVKILGSRVHSGSTKVDRKQETYWERIPCRLFWTSERFIALAETNGFSVRNDKVMDLKLHSDAIVIYTESKMHMVFLAQTDSSRYANVWRVIEEARKTSVDFSQFQGSKRKDDA